jgi:hypothetical protein
MNFLRNISVSPADYQDAFSKWKTAYHRKYFHPRPTGM